MLASLLYLRGESPVYVMHQMGHADPKLALRIYTEADFPAQWVMIKSNIYFVNKYVRDFDASGGASQVAN